MSVLNCVKPGAKPGQVILAVDLSMSGNPNQTIARLQALGYHPQIRHIAYTTGAHVLAILKDEYPSEPAEDYLLNEWMQLCTELNPNAVHLWRGTLNH